MVKEVKQLNTIIENSKHKWVMLDVCGETSAWEEDIKNGDTVIVIDTAKRAPLFYLAKIVVDFDIASDGEVIDDEEVQYADLQKL